MPLFLMCSSKLLIELPCKDGSAGLYLTSSTKCHLLGVDTSPAAIDIATSRAKNLGLADTARHQVVSNLSDTGLPSATADAVLSCDELWLAADQGAVLKVGLNNFLGGIRIKGGRGGGGALGEGLGTGYSAGRREGLLSSRVGIEVDF